MWDRISVSFSEEEGVDAGGLTREWYSILARDIFNPLYGLFINSGDSPTFQPNPVSGSCNPDHLTLFKFVGRIIAKALIDNQVFIYLLPFHIYIYFYYQT